MRGLSDRLVDLGVGSILAEAIETKQVKVVGRRFDLDDRMVEFLDES